MNHCFSGYGSHRYKSLAKFFGESTQGALFGLEHAGLIMREPVFDVVDAFDHDAPEQDRELTRQSDVGDQACAAGSQAAVEATQGDVLAAGEGARHHAEEASGAI